MKLVPIVNINQLKVGSIIQCDLEGCKKRHTILEIGEYLVISNDKETGTELFMSNPNLISGFEFTEWFKNIYLIVEKKSKLPNWF